MTPRRTARTTGIRRGRSPFEWVLLISSLVAILTVAIGLAVGGLIGPNGSADLRVTVDDAATASGGRAAEVTVENVGGAGAENVIIEIVAGDITREVGLPLVAEGDTESATVVFPSGTTGTLRAFVVSYTNP